MDEPSHRVTISDLYKQGEDTRSSVGMMTQQISVLLDRSETRDRQIESIDTRVSRLERVVYWVGVPLAVIASGSLGWGWLSGIV